MAVLCEKCGMHSKIFPHDDQYSSPSSMARKKFALGRPKVYHEDMEDHVLPNSLEEMEAALDKEDPKRRSYLLWLKGWGLTPNRKLRKKEKRQLRRRQKMMEKQGVSCDCGEGKAPQDLTKVASGKPVLCGDCGRTWYGEGKKDADDDSTIGAS